MIEGVKILPKKQIFDERGKIMHMVRNDINENTIIECLCITLNNGDCPFDQE